MKPMHLHTQWAHLTEQCRQICNVAGSPLMGCGNGMPWKDTPLTIADDHWDELKYLEAAEGQEISQVLLGPAFQVYKMGYACNAQ